ncbi:MAG: FAD-dependent thymidylate synthase [Candidatus Micrarchaeia archaeon]
MENEKNEKKFLLKSHPEVELVKIEGNLEDLKELMKEKTHGGSPKAWLQLGFTGPLEFIDVEYTVKCSRVCSHQIVRHRIGTSFIQHSGRFGDYSQVGDEDSLTFIYPNSILKNKEKREIIENTIRTAVDAYQKLKESNTPLEEARRVLPESIQTYIIIKFNLRSLGNFLRQRLCAMAQPEIREVAIQMLYQLDWGLNELGWSKEEKKLLYTYLLPPCVTIKHCINNKPVNDIECIKNGIKKAIEEHGEVKSFDRKVEMRSIINLFEEFKNHDQDFKIREKRNEKNENEKIKNKS